jgi:hypothetical protein
MREDPRFSIAFAFYVNCIDDIVSDLQNIFIHTAKSTFGYTLNEPRSTDKNPWFDNTSLQIS